jgi:hypothetical protein
MVWVFAAIAGGYMVHGIDLMTGVFTRLTRRARGS